MGVFDDNDIDQELLAEFLEESIEGLDLTSDLFVRLEQNPNDIEIIQAIFRPIHSVKGNSAFFNLIHTKKLTHSMENILDLLRKEAMRVSQTIIDTLLKGSDEVKLMLERVKSGQAEVSDEDAFNALVKKIENLVESEKETESNLWGDLLDILEHSEKPEIIAISKKLAALSSGGQQALAKRSGEGVYSVDSTAEPINGNEMSPVKEPEESVKQDKSDATKDMKVQGGDKSASKYMRVPEESIDTFLHYVGELITIGEMYSHFQGEFSSISSNNSASTELRRINEMFHNLSSSLQKSLLDIRLVPMNNILQKVPRIVRDIAVAEKKQIEVKITGEDILVDKSIVELLDTPLTHMVRNAVDHGIETPEERVNNNKPASGLIEVGASIVGEDVLLVVKDNGKGLNFAALEKKANDMGLKAENEVLTKKDVIDLIFQSGVSTAKEITDISGRGVGMDVVKSSIEQKKGTISVDSTEGQGSVFTVRMPMSVSTVIIKGLVTSVSNLNFIFPLESVVTTFALTPSDLVSVMGNEISIKKDGKIFPAFFISSLLNLERNNQSAMVILLEKDDKKIAVFVDEVLDIKQCVLKTIEGIDIEHKYIKGATIMGDGSVALVLDPENLF